jgi:hypothetical protein
MSSATVLNLRIGDRDAVQIGRLCDKSRASAIESAKCLIEAGKRLTEKKKSLNHGEWLPWLKENAGVLGFQEQTAQRLMAAAKTSLATDFTEDEASRIIRSVWGHKPKDPGLKKPAFTPPGGKTADTINAVLHDVELDGDVPSRDKISKRYGVTDRTAQLVHVSVRSVLSDRECQEVGDPQVSRDDLSMSAQQKLDVAIRQAERKLKAEHAERMRGIDEEVRQRVLVEGKEYLAKLQEMQNEAERNEKFYRKMINNRKPIYTVDQFNLLRKCLHQKGIAASEKDFNEAFDLIQNKKLQLTGRE